MKQPRISLKEAVRFHGHLGPYLVLGILAGEAALRKLRIKKYFGLGIKVWGANKRPKSCLIDGLQLSTGATYGKGNIGKRDGGRIKVVFSDLKNSRKIEVSLKQGLARKLNILNGHEECERFAKEIYKSKPSELFILTTIKL